MSEPQLFVGIDVAKAQRDIALRPTGERWAIPNDDTSIATPVSRLVAVHPTLIVLEATGGYQRAVVAALAAADLPVVVANPRQTRDFAKATGQLAKTDALDARGSPSAAPPPAQCADGGAAGPVDPAAATGRHAYGRGQPPSQCPGAGAGGPGGASCLARPAPDDAGRHA